MKYSLLLAMLLSVASLLSAQQMSEVTTIPPLVVTCQNANCDDKKLLEQEEVLKNTADLRISVIGQGVAPMNTTSPAQAYALAKRAAVGDAYRLIAEKVKGVRVDGQDLIKNMMVQKSSVRTSVNAMVRNSNIVETTFKDGLCEVEMEIILTHSQFSR